MQDFTNGMGRRQQLERSDRIYLFTPLMGSQSARKMVIPSVPIEDGTIPPDCVFQILLYLVSIALLHFTASVACNAFYAVDARMLIVCERTGSGYMDHHILHWPFSLALFRMPFYKLLCLDDDWRNTCFSSSMRCLLFFLYIGSNAI